MIYLDLLTGFLKVGFFSLGGGYGAIAIVRDVVLSYEWIDDETLMNMIAISESTPGPIMVNLATYVGYSQAGIPGGILATLAAITPAFFIILIVMVLLRRLFENRYIQSVIRGLKPCIMGIILATGVYMVIRNGIYPLTGETKDFWPVILTVVLAAAYYGSAKLLKKKLSPIKLIVISACLGVLVYGA